MYWRIEYWLEKRARKKQRKYLKSLGYSGLELRLRGILLERYKGRKRFSFTRRERKKAEREFLRTPTFLWLQSPIYEPLCLKIDKHGKVLKHTNPSLEVKEIEQSKEDWLEDAIENKEEMELERNENGER